MRKTFSKTFEKLKPNKQGAIGFVVICIIVFVLLAVIAAIALPVVFVPLNYRLIGSYTYDYEPTANWNLTLDIDQSAGGVSIEYDDSLTSLFHAKVDVYGRREATLDDATNFTAQTVGDRVIIGFDTTDLVFSFRDLTAVYHKLDITINPNAKVKYDILAHSGGIDIDLDSNVNSTIEQLKLFASSGGININFGEKTVVNTDVIDFSASSGGIEVDFGVDAVLDCDEISLSALAGGVSIIANDIYFMDDVTWSIIATSGGIDLTIGLSFLPIYSYTALFDMEASSGGITVNYSLNENNVGVKITASASSGGISLPGGGNSYESSGYASKNAKYFFDLSVSSGGIKVYD